MRRTIKKEINPTQFIKLPKSGKTKKNEFIDKQFDIIKGEINDYYKLDLEKWEKLENGARAF